MGQELSVNLLLSGAASDAFGVLTEGVRILQQMDTYLERSGVRTGDTVAAATPPASGRTASDAYAALAVHVFRADGERIGIQEQRDAAKAALDALDQTLAERRAEVLSLCILLGLLAILVILVVAAFSWGG